MEPTATPTLDRLRRLLVGQCITSVSGGDWWVLRVANGHYVVAQKIAAPDADVVCAALRAGSVDLLASAVDPDDIVAAVSVLRCARRDITAVSLQDDGSLTLEFEGGERIWLRTDSDVVDWHWGVNATGADPFSSCVVGCFERGHVIFCD